MTVEYAKIGPKGQITIPNLIRKIYHLNADSIVAISITPRGIVLVPTEIKEKAPYTKEEWGKIEALASKKGKTFKSAKDAKKYLSSL